MPYSSPAERARSFLEALEERQSILEHDAGMSPEEAYRRAGPMTLASFREADECCKVETEEPRKKPRSF